MKFHLIRIGLAAALMSSTAMAQDAFQSRIIDNLRGQGYDYIEFYNGPSQLKVEAVRGTEKLEVVYDLATGNILKQERERAAGEYLGRTGIEFNRENRDFLDDDDDDDDDRGRGRDDNDDDDDDDDDRSRDRDDNDDDDDDDDDDDSGSSSGGGSSSGSDDNDDDDDDDNS